LKVSHGLGDAGLWELERELQAECASLGLRPGIKQMWAGLRRRSMRVGVCANLALPYRPPLRAALPDIRDTGCSYEVGLVKPDPAIFRLVCDRLELQPTEVLFVGNTSAADVDGPQAIGMPAMLISEFERLWPRHDHLLHSVQSR
jgi:FMN phosphatase YigB (HAD superfamily)